MEQLNRIELRGNVGNVRVSDVGGNRVARFSLATNFLYKGKDSEAVSVLRLWKAKPVQDFNMKLFSQGDYYQAMAEDNDADVLTKVLYPADNHLNGKCFAEGAGHAQNHRGAQRRHGGAQHNVPHRLPPRSAHAVGALTIRARHRGERVDGKRGDGGKDHQCQHDGRRHDAVARGARHVAHPADDERKMIDFFHHRGRRGTQSFLNFSSVFLCALCGEIYDK